MSKKKQLQAARQEAWEREIKMQTQALRMISLGCVWEGETTTIAAKQLEKLLSFKVKAAGLKPFWNVASQPLLFNSQFLITQSIYSTKYACTFFFERKICEI